MPRADDDKVDGNGDDIFILPNMRLLSMPSSLQSTEQQLLFAAMQLHEMCSDSSSGDDARRRRRHVLSSLQLSSDEADDGMSFILSIIIIGVFIIAVAVD